MWGLFLVLLDELLENVVDGICCEIEWGDGECKLAEYVTDRYICIVYKINMEDGNQVFGIFFKWFGNINELEEGSFDLETCL